VLTGVYTGATGEAGCQRRERPTTATQRSRDHENDTSRRALLGGLWAALTALTITTAGLAAFEAGAASAAPRSGAAPIVRVADGAVRGAAVSGVDESLGLPYAAPPTGDLRWRPPRPPAEWDGVRDATQFAPSRPQPVSPLAPPPPFSENCLYLNVYAPTLRHNSRPVLVWIHGGGFTEDGARNYDGSKLAADGTVVVTINYRLGRGTSSSMPGWASFVRRSSLRQAEGARPRRRCSAP
jgi:para-nitrobenzyl esterase